MAKRRIIAAKMSRPTNTSGRHHAHAIRPVACQLFFLPVQTRVPLKFGSETLTSITCARVQLIVECADGRRVEGWGETPLSVQWVWPAELGYQDRHKALKQFCVELTTAWASCNLSGHALEIGHDFQQEILPALTKRFNEERPERGHLPHLAALVCCSAFDLALHDACGQALGRPSYQTYTRDYLDADLSHYLAAADDSNISFAGKYPSDFLRPKPLTSLPVWHLVGALDPVDRSELRGDAPDDGYPILLTDWIQRDGLKCLKIKQRGTDSDWDFRRLVTVGQVAAAQGVERLSADFNCTVTDPQYVNDVLDRLRVEHPRLHDLLLYVEQPFPYDLERWQIDVRSVAQRKPLFMDESAHDWRMIRLGRSLGWNGVALKTCKTQTGAILSLCWAKAHGMALMVQDLTNPMLAMIPHALLAAHAETICGVESNAPQFYPEASRAESLIHPGLFTRRNGIICLDSVSGNGFGYRLGEIRRALPPPAAASP
jgi:L-alanine-DL-glutamate epimerase-like enolase superfamily enzyme